MEQPAVALNEVTVYRRGTRVLGPLTATIPAGSFCGVIGPNGAGKSTFLRVITGHQKPSQGSVTVLGNAQYHSGALPRSKLIGILLQHHDFFPDIPFTVDDIVLFGRSPFHGPGIRYDATDHETRERALEIMDLTGYRHRLYRELSGGEQRKVHLARLIAQNPDLLLLDEPASGLDLEWQERLTRLVGNLFRMLNRTVIMVTHDISRLPSCCNRVILLKNGSVMCEGTPGDVLTAPLLSELYGCGVDVSSDEGRFIITSVQPQEYS